MIIPNKKTFLDLSIKGKLGNRFRVSTSVIAALASGAPVFYIRGPVARWHFMVPWVNAEDLESTVQGIEARGGKRDDMYFSEVVKKGVYRSINAEAKRDEHGLTLTYGTSSHLSLRDDVARNGIMKQGLAAWLVLRRRVPPEDVDMLCEIWEEYPDCIIEFSTYPGKYVGVMKRSTIIWEVRSYIVFIGALLAGYGW